MKCVMLDWNERDQYRPMALNKYIFTDTKIQKEYRCTWKHRLVCIHTHTHTYIYIYTGFPSSAIGKETIYRCRRPKFDP